MKPLLLLISICSLLQACLEPEKLDKTKGALQTDDTDRSNADTAATKGTSIAFFKEEVHGKFREHCAPCHASIEPSFAVESVEDVRELLISPENNLVDLNDLKNSRLITRLANDKHRCWKDCDDNADFLLDLLKAWVILEVGEGNLEANISSGTSSGGGSDTTGSDTTGSDTTGSDTTGSDTTGSDTTGSDTTGSDTTGSDTTGSDTGGDPGSGTGGGDPNGDNELKFASFKANLYPLLVDNCSNCHAAIISPNFASAQAETAFNIVLNHSLSSGEPLVNENQVTSSGLVMRLGIDKHMCWSENCDSDAGMMADAIQKFFIEANSGGTPPPVDPGVTCASSDLDASPRKIRLLSNKEYINSINDLFPGIAVNLSLSNDISKHNQFDNITEERKVQSTDLTLFLNAAIDVSKGIYWAATAPCSASTTLSGALACLDTFLSSAGTKIWRRPLTSEEKSNLQTVFSATYSEIPNSPNYTAAMEDTLAAMLISNNFLYRTELGSLGNDGYYTLDSYEIASALSYFYWRSTPDATLMSLAANNQLQQPAVIKEQVTRLMADDKFKETLKDFVSYWLEAYKIFQSNKDPALYPQFNSQLQSALFNETTEFFVKIVGSGKSYKDLMTSNKSVGDQNLASFYQATYSNGEIIFDANKRQGVLGHASFLGSNAYPDSPSPIHRGVSLIENVLCKHFPEPPAVMIPDIIDSVSNKDRFAAHSENQECAVCHESIDQVGFSFENFDALGLFRLSDGGSNIDASGSITLDGTKQDYTGLSGLAQLLGSSNEAKNCMIQQLRTFQLGRPIKTKADKCQMERLKTNHSNQSAINDIVKAMFDAQDFRKRK